MHSCTHVPFFDNEPLPACRPHANSPLRRVTLALGGVVPAWFDQRGTATFNPDKPNVINSSKECEYEHGCRPRSSCKCMCLRGNERDVCMGTVVSLIEEEIASGVPVENIVIGGFSQGGSSCRRPRNGFNRLVVADFFEVYLVHTLPRRCCLSLLCHDEFLPSGWSICPEWIPPHEKGGVTGLGLHLSCPSPPTIAFLCALFLMQGCFFFFWLSAHALCSMGDSEMQQGYCIQDTYLLGTWYV